MPLLFRVLWQLYPSFWACALFWLSFLAMELMYACRGGNKDWQAKTPIFAGAAMNAAVTLANDGRMPVLGSNSFMSVWVRGEGKHLLFLCDRFGGFSLGDFFIIGGALFLILRYFLRKPPNPAVSTAK